jgi:hypothetical protein
MLKKAAVPFMILAALGLAASAAAHAAAALGLRASFPTWVMGLHVGVFVVFLPAAFVVHRLTRDYTQREIWTAALRGCPDWMRKGVYGLFGYAFVNFLYFIATVPKGRAAAVVAGETPAVIVRGFSGHWMIFYAVSFAILYSYRHAEEADDLRRCPNGHRVSAVAKFCQTCGGGVGGTIS